MAARTTRPPRHCLIGASETKSMVAFSGSSRDMRRLAVLHIGVTKTGTTSIQHWLAGQGAALDALGMCHPESPGKRNHFKLAARREHWRRLRRQCAGS